MNRKKIMFSFATAAMAAVGLFAELVPAPLFNHGMVLQRDKKVAVWGKADVGADVTVAFAGASVTGKAGENGAWRVDLPAMEACAIPREMRISSSEGDKIVYTNAVVGEVWLCGGQSNMTAAMWPKPQMFVYAARERNGYFDIMLTNEPDIRAVRVKEKWAAEETDREQFEWFSFTGGNGANFSAVAWHYAVRLHQALGIPVGVVQSAWGASNIETWIPAEGFAASKSFKSIAGMPVSTELNEDEKKRKAAAPDMQKRPRACWNAMIYPLVPYT